MYKASELDLDKTVKYITENELGILLVQSDTENPNHFDIDAKGDSYLNRHGMFGNDTQITYHVFKLMFHKDRDQIESNYAEDQMNAIQNVFERWNKAGYNTYHNRSPFNAKLFWEYLDSLDFYKSDYLLLLVD